jgi:hypothetical protein
VWRTKPTRVGTGSLRLRAGAASYSELGLPGCDAGVAVTLREGLGSGQPKLGGSRSNRAAAAFIGLLIALITGVFAGTSGAFATEPASKEFFAAAIGVLSAVLLAVAFQLPWLLASIRRLFSTGDRVLLVPLLGGFIVSVGAAIASGLSALNACSEEACGSVDDASTVIGGLIIGALVLVIVVLVGFMESGDDSS